MLSKTASQPSSIARETSDAVPIPASTKTGQEIFFTISSIASGLIIPKPDPIGAASGITAQQPESSSLRA